MRLPEHYVLIYDDEGTSNESVAGCTAWLQQSGFSSVFHTKVVNASRLTTDLRSIKSNRMAIVVPGGADLPYMEKLGTEGMRLIRRSVFDGGSYIGICAGAYFASAYCLFERQDTKLRVMGQRPLALFPGAAIGAVREGFCYGSEKGATMEQLHCEWKDKKFDAVTYCNGGAAWLFPGVTFAHTTVIARYSEPVLERHGLADPRPVAILSHRFGKGHAVLSGVHPEIAVTTGYSENRGVANLRQAIVEGANLKFRITHG